MKTIAEGLTDIEYTPRHCGFCGREFKTRGARVTHEDRCLETQRIRAAHMGPEAWDASVVAGTVSS